MKYIMVVSDNGVPVFYNHPRGEMLCPTIIGLKDNVGTNFGQLLTQLTCGKLGTRAAGQRTEFVFAQRPPLTLLIVSDESESKRALERQLQQVHQLLLLVFGPKALYSIKYTTFLRHQTFLHHIIDTAFWLNANHQCFLVESVDRLVVNEFLSATLRDSITFALCASEEEDCGSPAGKARNVQASSWTTYQASIPEPSKSMFSGFSRFRPLLQRRAEEQEETFESTVTHALVFVGTKLLCEMHRVSSGREKQKMHLHPTDIKLLFTLCQGCLDSKARPLIKHDIPIDERDGSSSSISLSSTVPAPSAPIASLDRNTDSPKRTFSTDSSASPGPSTPVSPAISSSLPDFTSYLGSSNTVTPKRPPAHRERTPSHAPVGPHTPFAVPAQRKGPSSAARSPGDPSATVDDLHPNPSSAAADRVRPTATSATVPVTAGVGTGSPHRGASSKAVSISSSSRLRARPDGEVSTSQVDSSAEVADPLSDVQSGVQSGPVLRESSASGPPRSAAIGNSVFRRLYLRLPTHSAHYVYCTQLESASISFVLIMSKKPDQLDILERTRQVLEERLHSYHDYFVAATLHSTLPSLHKFPGVVHYLLVDRTPDQGAVLAPTIAPLHGQRYPTAEVDLGNMTRSIKSRMWQMYDRAHNQLAQGYNFVVRRHGDFSYSYRLWITDEDDNELVATHENISTLYKESLHIDSDCDTFYRNLLQTHPNRKAAHCYELYALFVGALSPSTVVQHTGKMFTHLFPYLHAV